MDSKTRTGTPGTPGTPGPAAAPIASNAGTLDKVVRLLKTGNVQKALGALNAGVAHRYTGIYQIEGNVMRNLFLYDRTGEARSPFLSEIQMGSSFCQFVLRDGVFLTDDSRCDDRLNGHPYKGVMVAYHGVSLADAEGGLAGALSHFDVQPRGLDHAQFDELQSAARLLSTHLFGNRTG